ncbi:hypothetical protein Dimus_033216 [Dionaea muscipula]
MRGGRPSPTRNHPSPFIVARAEATTTATTFPSARRGARQPTTVSRYSTPPPSHLARPSSSPLTITVDQGRRGGARLRCVLLSPSNHITPSPDQHRPRTSSIAEHRSPSLLSTSTCDHHSAGHPSSPTSCTTLPSTSPPAFISKTTLRYWPSPDKEDRPSRSFTGHRRGVHACSPPADTERH